MGHTIAPSNIETGKDRLNGRGVYRSIRLRDTFNNIDLTRNSEDLDGFFRHSVNVNVFH